MMLAVVFWFSPKGKDVVSSNSSVFELYFDRFQANSQ